MRLLERIDVFRKIPKDLTSPSGRGAVLSVVATVVMILLAVMETIRFARGDLRSTITVSSSKNDVMALFFRLTFPKTPCDALFMELLDYKGNMVQSVEGKLLKSSIREAPYAHRKIVDLRRVPQVHSNDVLGLQASTVLTAANFTAGVRSKPHVFVNFYASWCPHCQQLAPTWEALALSTNGAYSQNVLIASVNCVEQQLLCVNQMIRGLPTMRLFRQGRALTDYQGRRTIEAFTSFLETNMVIPAQDGLKAMPVMEGCMMQLKTMVYAVPGQIYVGVKTDVLAFKREQVNLTHEFNWMQFGDNIPFGVSLQLPKQTRAAFRARSSAVFTSDRAEQAHSHYLKLVGTVLEKSAVGGRDLVSYQYTATHDVSRVKSHLPEVRIIYDISPTVIRLHNASVRWYEYFTKLAAIMGGFFTIMGLVDTGVAIIVQKAKKDNMGKLS